VIGAVAVLASVVAFHADPGGSDDLFLLNAATGNVERLTSGLEAVATPAWSPNGSRLAFIGRAGGAGDVYVTDPNGSVKRLTHKGDHFDVAWSPDGARLAYTCCAEGSLGLYVMDADGRHARKLVADAGNPAWSPDGTRIAYVSVARDQVDIYTIAADGDGRRRLTRARGEDADPTWSPDGKRIAFDSRRTGRSQIFVMGADGSRQHRLMTDRWNDQQPRWSPNGGRLVFTSYRNRDPNLLGIGNAEVVVVTLAGARTRNLTRSRFWEGDPAWSPDGGSIAFATRRDFGPNGRFTLETIRADGTARRGWQHVERLRANACCPAWRP